MRIVFPPDTPDITDEILHIIKENDGPNSGLSAQSLNGVDSKDLLNISTKNQILASVRFENQIGSIIKKPVISFPPNGYTNLLVEPFTVYEYIESDTFVGLHTETDWELSLTIDFSSIEDYSYKSKINILQWRSNKLLNNQKYFLRVRFRSNNHISEWSDTIEFTTGLVPHLETPIILISGYPNSIPTSPDILVNGFNMVNDVDLHISTDWNITNKDNVVMWASGNDSINLLNINILDDVLQIDNEYTCNVTLNGDRYSSSNSIKFTPTFTQGIVSPTIFIDGEPYNILEGPTVILSRFKTVGMENEYHVNTEIRLLNSDDEVVYTNVLSGLNLYFFNIPKTATSLSDTFKLMVRYIGNTSMSEWSYRIFKPSKSRPVNTPTIVIAKEPMVDVMTVITPEVRLSCTGSPAVQFNNNLTLISTDWRIYNDHNHIVWSQSGKTVDPSTLVITNYNLIQNRNYIFLARCLYRYLTTSEDRLYYSNWGISSEMTGDTSVIDPPSFIIEGDHLLVTGGPTLTLTSDFKSAVSNDVHISTDWDIISKNGIVVWSEYGAIEDKYSVVVPAGTMADNTVYTIRCRLNGVTYPSPWTIKDVNTQLTKLNSRWDFFNIGVLNSIPINLNSHNVKTMITAIGKYAILVVGEDNGGNQFAGIFNTKNKEYRSIENPPTTSGIRRYGNCSILKNDSVVEIGTYANKARGYSLKKNNWYTNKDIDLDVFNHGQSVMINDSIMITGGNLTYLDNDANTVVEITNKVYVYDFYSENGPMQMTHGLKYCRARHSQNTLLDGRIIVTGGICDGAYVKKSEIFNSQSGLWDEFTVPDLPFALINHSAYTLSNGSMVILGGYTENNDNVLVFNRTMLSFDIAIDNTWNVLEYINTIGVSNSITMDMANRIHVLSHLKKDEVIDDIPAIPVNTTQLTLATYTY